MRAGPYLHLMRTAFLKLMAYRMRYVTGIATYSIFVGVHYFVWQAIYAARTEPVGGMNFEQLITYIGVGYIARSAYYNNLDSEIGARFQNGEVTMDLLRPISFHGNYLSQATGETAFRILFFALPMSLVIVPVFGVQPPTGDGWWQFPLLFLVAFAINAELNLLAGTCAFFLEDITGLMSFKRNLTMLLSGLLVPLHFLRELVGDGVVDVMLVLPFAFIGYYPVMGYIGQLGADGTPDLAVVLAMAPIWILVLRGINLAIWSWAKRRLEVQGG